LQRYKATIEYDGTGLAGFQKQRQKLTIEELIENALYCFSGESPTQIGVAGRTDAGVHAYGQVIHFDMAKDASLYSLQHGINHHLNNNKYNIQNQVAIVNLEPAPKDFDARFSAKKRHYKYRIYNRSAQLVLDYNRAWQIPQNLDIEQMQLGANFLMGEKYDFTSFRSSECNAKNAIRQIDSIDVKNRISDKIEGGGIIEIDIVAKSFLHHMVRNITGSLVNIGLQKWSPEKMKEILQAKDRSKAGPTAPAWGLFFMKVEY